MNKRFKKIYIEITNNCNLNCSFCPKTSRKIEFIDLDFFEKIIIQTKPFCDEITLHIMGEPLTHPKFKDIVLSCEKNDVKINLTTNGTYIKRYGDLLLNSAIRRINFSMHGIDSNFTKEQKKEILKEIINFTKTAQNKKNELIITYRLWNVDDKTRDSNKEIINFIEKEFNVKIMDCDGKKSVKVKNNCFVHYDYSFDWPSEEKNKIESTRGYCHGLSTHIGILVDGTVVPCCLDSEGKIPLGNLKEDTLKNILETKRANNIRAGFKARKLIEDLCKNCTYIRRFDK